LWLFTDEQRLADPRFSVACLPRGRAGVVLRHDSDPARRALGEDLARICRARRLVLVVAGDVRLAADLRAGVHLRGGRWFGPLRRAGVVTSSAHSIPDLRRARAAGADLVFLSPAFPTASHAGAPGLGPLRWARMAGFGLGRLPAGTAETEGIRAGGSATRIRRLPDSGVAALGGMDGQTVKRLPVRLLRAVGAIGALSTTCRSQR
jgi:thiamine-phosphate pyrophosphorylase